MAKGEMVLQDAVHHETDSCLILNPVVMLEGTFHLRLPERTLPIRQAGAPVTSFVPGWYPTRLFIGFAPLLILEFKHEGGSVGAWFLDSRLEHMGGDVGELPAHLKELLIRRARPVLQQVMTVFVSDKPFEPGPIVRGFLSLAPHLRRAIAGLLADELLPRPQSYLAADFGTGQTPIVFPANGAQVGQFISEAHLVDGFTPEWQDKLLKAARTGSVEWPSPIDGVSLACRGSVILDDFHFAFRFVDERFALVFYVVVADHRSVVAGVWFPSFGLIISLDEAQRALANMLAWHLPARFVSHVVTWANDLAIYFRTPPKGLRNVLRGSPGVHIGHQLWNELTGIDALVDTVPDSRVIHLVNGAGKGLEIYGPIDQIFPMIAGKVVRDFRDIDAMIKDSYQSGNIVFRMTQDFVKETLRRKLLNHAHQQARAKAIQLPSGPMLLIGLRVENRTVVDLERFLLRLMAMIERRFPRLAVVFDGHNASDENAGSQTISSHGESMARIAPNEVERLLIENVRNAFPQRKHLIYDTLMEPVSASIAWADVCRGFVSIWGASLAKYRWVANLPGYVITSEHNLRLRPDLDIYHSTRYMEAPTPLEFVEKGLVHDDPRAEQLVPVGGAQLSFCNFTLDEEAVLERIARFIERVVLA